MAADAQQPTAEVEQVDAQLQWPDWEPETDPSFPTSVASKLSSCLHNRRPSVQDPLNLLFIVHSPFNNSPNSQFPTVPTYQLH